MRCVAFGQGGFNNSLCRRCLWYSCNKARRIWSSPSVSVAGYRRKCTTCASNMSKKTKMSTLKRQIVFAGRSTAQLLVSTWRVPCVRHRTLLARSSTTSPCSPSEEQTAPETWQEVEKLHTKKIWKLALCDVTKCNSMYFPGRSSTTPFSPVRPPCSAFF